MQWYETFFTELPNTFWRAAVPPEQTAHEVDFALAVSGLGAGGRVLDIPCGSGRHAIELSRRGYRVTGQDVSAEAIAHARSQDDTVDWIVGDMRRLPDLTVDLAMCMGNSFGYLDHGGTEKFLADLAERLAPGGTLLIDHGFAAESVLPGITLVEPPMVLGGVEATSVNSYDVAHSRWITEFTFRRGDEEHRGTSVQHVYTVAETVRLAERAGFTDVRLYGGTDRRPYVLGDPRLLLVARTG